MKTTRAFLMLCLFTVLTTTLFAQSAADRILGTYTTFNDKTGQEESKIQIFKSTNGKYFGKISWLKEPSKNGKSKVDENNPDKALQDKPLIGLQLLKSFVYDEKQVAWLDGSIYDPESGKTYHCVMKFDGEKDLSIRGFIGKAWMGLGRTTTWKKD